jgi:hypothetical protein
VPYPPGCVGGKYHMGLQQVVFRKLEFVFKKLGFDTFDISIMNKHQGKYT